MEQFILNVLSKMRPAVGNVISSESVTHRDLTLTEIRFMREQKYYAATAYSTSTWVAPSPMGPQLREDGTFKMDCLGDVATVDTYTSFRAMMWRRPLTDAVLRDLQRSLDLAACDLIVQNYPFLDDILYKTMFTFTPFPTIQVCLATNELFRQLLGTIAVGVDGSVMVTSKTSQEVERYADMMRGMGCLPVSKELGYA